MARLLFKGIGSAGAASTSDSDGMEASVGAGFSRRSRHNSACRLCRFEPWAVRAGEHSLFNYSTRWLDSSGRRRCRKPRMTSLKDGEGWSG